MEDATEILSTAGIHNARREASWLAEVATDEEDLIALARRRAAGEPLQYLTGVAGFRHVELSVGPGVFIPRPETESLVDLALEHLPHEGCVVDVGTGSGAIALSIAHERPDATIYATEVDPDARAWAERNRDALGLRVSIVGTDMFQGLPGVLRGATDVVVSNPPYVATVERGILPVEVVAHEPHTALFSGGRGLDVIERLVVDARSWLREGGWLVLEIGEKQGEAVTALLESAGYSDALVRDDLTGRPRYAEARYVR